MSYLVYILRCQDNSYYIGKTTDITRRLREHNGEIKGGAKYTSGRRPVELVYTEQHQTVTEALRREFMLKKLSRDEKEKIIASSAS